MKVYSDDKSCDQSAWLGQKIGYVLLDTISLMEGSPELKTNSAFGTLLSDVLKIYAFSYDLTKEVYCDLVYNFILDYGINAYFLLEGFLNNTIGSEYIKQIKLLEKERIIANRIIEIINSQVTEKRAKINSELDKIKTKNHWFKIIDEEIDMVNLGKETLDWFCDRHKSDKFDNSKDIDPRVYEVYKYLITIK